jgi:ribose-phosphate pyrophosphokinase
MRYNDFSIRGSSIFRAKSQAHACCTGAIERRLFDDGEKYFRLAEDNRMGFFGKNVILVASVVSDDNLIEMQRLGSALVKCGARRVIYVIPFEAYTTMERSVKANEIVTAKDVARQLSQLPAGDFRNCFLFMDLHTSGFVHYFEGDCVRFELYAEEVLTEVVRTLGLSNFMFGSADLGRAKWVETFAKRFDTDIAFVRKTRDGEHTQIHEVIGDVSGKKVVIYDDMTRSAKSLIKAANAYLAHGATEVHAVISHLALNNESVVDLLNSSQIKTIVTTNSHPMSQHPNVTFSHKFIVKDVSHLFVQAILNLQ